MIFRISLIFAFVIAIFDASAQWHEIAYSESVASGHNALFFTSNDTGYIAGTESIDSNIQSYVLRTYDGGMSWDTTFIANKRFRSIHFPTMSTGFIAFVENNHVGVLRTQNRGDNWTTVTDSIVLANPVSLEIIFFDNNRGVISMEGASYLTVDGGLSWSLQENHPSGGTGKIDASGEWFGEVGGTQLIKSQDQCDSYELQIVTDSASGSAISLWQSNLAMSFMGGFGPELGYPHFNFARLLTGQANTTEFVTQDFPLLNRIRELEIVDQDVIYALIYSYENDGPRFMKSEDSGITWFAQGVTEDSENYLLVVKNLHCLNDSICYAASGDVIYKTTNGGGPLLDPIESIVLSTENQISEIEFNVFPNPSTGHLTLESEGSLENISVFDSLGKLVFQESLKNRIRHALNLSHLPKGLYLIRVSGDGFEKTEKVVLE